MAIRYPWQIGPENRLLQMNVFSDQPWLGRDCFDADAGEFVDLAGFDGHRTDDYIGPRCEIIAGTPTFVDVGARRGIRLDRSCHLRLALPNYGHGAVYAVFKPTYGSATMRMLIFGNLGTASSQGHIRIYGASNQVNIVNANALSSASVPGLVSGANRVAMLGWDEEDRRVHGTINGTSVTNGGQWAVANTGRPMMNNSEANEGNAYVRLGDHDGTGNLTPDASNYIDLVELGFIQNVPVRTDLAAVKDVIDTQLGFL